MSDKINLQQMQKYFEGQMNRVRIISDLELSENDFKSLSARLKSLCFFTGSENDIEDFMLSIAVYSSYSLIYGDVGADFNSIIWMVLNNSQYMERLHLRMLKDVYHIYGLSTYDIDHPDLTECCRELVARHAGIPNCEKNAVFDIISEYLGVIDIAYMQREIYNRLPDRSRYILGMLSEEQRGKLILDMRMLVGDVMDRPAARQEFIARYPQLSYSLIDRCMIWNENNSQRIRYRIF